MCEFIYPNILEPKLARTHQNCSSCPPLTLNLRTGRTKFSMYTAVDSRRIMLRTKLVSNRILEGWQVRARPECLQNIAVEFSTKFSRPNIRKLHYFPRFSLFFLPF